MTGPHPRPVWQSAYDAQVALWRWYDTDPARRWLAAHYHANVAPAIEAYPKAVEHFKNLYMAELSRLIDCDPIYVSADMCDVIAAAKDTFQPEPLIESDIITPRGFLYFAKPVEVLNRRGDKTLIAGCSWTRIFEADTESQMQAAEAATVGLRGWDEVELVMHEHGMKVGGLALTIYGRTFEYRQRFSESSNDDREAAEVLATAPLLCPIHLTPWYLDQPADLDGEDLDGHPTAILQWWRVLQTSLRLMQQRIAHKTVERPDRASRREARKAGSPREAGIVVVRLRHEQPEGGEPSGEPGNWSHRWIVGGHWRSQWYPSERLHRQVWISPYVKGPDDKPLIVRPRRVYQWTR